MSKTASSHRRPIIGVMGKGENAAEIDIRTAEVLGELIAKQGWTVLSGGRNAGVMDAALRGAKKVEGSLTIGILPNESVSASTYIDIPVITGLGEARNYINILTSDFVVACGEGGAGTTSEIALALKAGKPVILLNATHQAVLFFKDISPDICICSTPQEAVTYIKGHIPNS